MKLKEYLKKKEIKNVELAKVSGASIPQISYWINGWAVLPPKYEQKISEFLGCSIEEIKSGKIRGGEK